jgi:transcriptional regulator with XRE-family HTH domain
MPKGYPLLPITLGEHLRKSRMDKGLQIKDVSKLLGVSECTWANWELRGYRPRARYRLFLQSFISHTDKFFKVLLMSL